MAFGDAAIRELLAAALQRAGDGDGDADRWARALQGLERTSNAADGGPPRVRGVIGAIDGVDLEK